MIMICPHCGSQVESPSGYCPICGKELNAKPNRSKTNDNRSAAYSEPAQAGGYRTAPVNSGASAKTAEKTARTGLMLGAAARAARLKAAYEEGDLVGSRTYNAIMMGVVLWGILVNYLLCRYVGNVYEYIPPIPFMIGYIVLAIAGIVIAGKSQKPAVSFLGYNMVVVPFGLVISTLVEVYGGIDSAIVTYAFMYTLFITVGMTAAAMLFPQAFAKLGGALLGVLIGVIVCELLLLLLGVSQSVTDWIAAALFSLYIGFDIYRSQQFAKTIDNAVDCALDIYLDIANLFVRLLSILAKKKD